MTILAALDRYLDAVPRPVARAEDFGPLTLFVREDPGWPYYGRPTPGHAGPVRAGDVRAVLDRQAELRIPQSFEWVGETCPSLAQAAAAAGLAVQAHPLLVLGDLRDVGSTALPVRSLDADDPLLASASACQHLGFASLGTDAGDTGLAELRERAVAARTDGSVARLGTQVRSGRGVLMAAVDGGDVLSAGVYIPVADTAEVVGVATLPVARRRGLAAAVTEALARDALAHGISTLFLSAQDEAVARVYRRLGFLPVGTAMEAAPPQRDGDGT